LFRLSSFVSDFNFGNHIIFFMDLIGRKLLNVYIIRPDLHQVLFPLQTQIFCKILQQLPDHNAAREMRLIPNVFNGHGQNLHQVGKFLKITGFFHFFLQPHLHHQLFDDLVAPHYNSFSIAIVLSALFVSKIIRTHFFVGSRRHFCVAIFSRPS
jgi:hypothetical protein